MIIEKIEKPSILYLDIDGVLNSLSTAIAFKHGYTDNHWSPVSVGLLRDLCERANCKIVITSSKRKRYTVEDCIEHFTNLFRDIYHWHNAPVIGKTPALGLIRNKLTQKHETRGYEIEAWFKANGSLVEYTENYVILDDDSDYKADQMNRFVKCNFANGFDFCAYNKALNILGYPHNDFNVHSEDAIAQYSRL